MTINLMDSLVEVFPDFVNLSIEMQGIFVLCILIVLTSLLVGTIRQFLNRR